MTGANSIAFENGSPVQVVNPVFPKDDDEGAADMETPTASALELLQHGLLIVLGDGHADGTRARALALARICGLFQTDAEAARFGSMNRSNISRGVRRLRREILKSLTPIKPCESPENKSD